MNRRGFFGLLGKLVAVGTAIGVSPALLKPVENAFKITSACIWVEADTMEPTLTVWMLQADGSFKCTGEPFENFRILADDEFA